jgi:parallel beta-helix repeat protein
MVLGAAGLITAPARAATTRVVDDDGKATPTNCGALTAAPATINAGIAAASPGDTVKVCPGTYSENVVIDKTLTLVGAKVGVNGATRAFNASAESIIATASETLDAVDVNADNVTVDGFTMQNSNAGVSTESTISGYVIRNNIIRANVMGVWMTSNGATTSLVNRNRVTNNNKGEFGAPPPQFSGGGIISFDGLSNAIIYGNFVSLNRGAGTFWINCGGGVNSGLTIASNTMQNNAGDIILGANNTSVKIQKNTTDDTVPSNKGFVPPAIQVGLYNTNVVIGGPTDASANTINRSPEAGILLDQYDFCSPAAALPAGGISVAHNTITNSFREGIAVLNGIPGVANVSGNRANNNGTPGIFFGNSTTGNVITGNTANGNGTYDCQDESTGGPSGSPTFGTQNSWTLNTGETSSPSGICTSSTPPPPT